MEAKDLSALIAIYETFAGAENKSPRTIETVTAAVCQFDRFLGGCDDVRRVSAEDLRKYIRHLQHRERWTGHPTVKRKDGQLSPHSVACYIRGIRSFWSWLKREQFIDENPFEKVKPPKSPRKVVRTLTVDQMTQLLNAIPRKDPAGYRDYTIVIILYGTGMRVGELLGLRLGDINTESGQIRIMGKGAKERFVYMSPAVHRVLLKYLLQWRPKVGSDLLLVHGDGRSLTRFYVAARIRGWAGKAGITDPRVTPHVFRHTFAVEYLRNGGDTFTLQRILGHTTLDMTRHYAEVSNSDVEVKQKRFSPAEKLSLRV